LRRRLGRRGLSAAPPVMAFRCDGVAHGGDVGSFRGNAESFGWRGGDGARMVVRPASAARRAEWRDGDLRVLVEAEGCEPEVLAFDGFPAQSFDELWTYFEAHCGVYVKKHRHLADVSGKDFDAAIRGIEEAADRIDEAAPGSVTKRAQEVDLMKRVEGLRDGLAKAISGDKRALSGAFAENDCERIGRLRLIIDTVQLEVFDRDPRFLHLANMATSVESVLRELGTLRRWKPPHDGQHESILRRQMVWELRKRQGHADPYQNEEPPTEAPANEGTYLNQPVLQPLELKPEGTPAPSPPVQQPLPLGSDLLSKLHVESSPLTKATVIDEPASHPPVAQQPATMQNEGRRAESITTCQVDVDFGRFMPERRGRSREERPRRRRRSDGRMARALLPERRDYADIFMQGWVWKRSQHLRKWRRRWLVLKPDYFATYKAAGAIGAATERVEKGCVVDIYSADSEVRQTRCFCVQAVQKRSFSTKMVKLFMVCDDDAQKEEWMASIDRVLGAAACRARHD